jgi:hypothetical protein
MVNEGNPSPRSMLKSAKLGTDSFFEVVTDSNFQAKSSKYILKVTRP